MDLTFYTLCFLSVTKMSVTSRNMYYEFNYMYKNIFLVARLQKKKENILCGKWDLTNPWYFLETQANKWALQELEYTVFSKHFWCYHSIYKNASFEHNYNWNVPTICYF